ncbi:8-oxoguanine DNA glycosylase [Methanosarcina horonobensis HB-1 = JCM 15518]|uniref:8-oxoguanine DNA glycosylase n=1 Tax=Methanosarcina horonobensis HB-1 = JCM 15518 TaxID=1434110 RepID=A0A0E3S7T4_9EURY|nr:hypothetical protein [Methanosarcina horonobensis]AKB77464.1 8-oxoguanine DNA glycosylase [Methanosarcina horonobensis HB-1 = JCM 15518]
MPAINSGMIKVSGLVNSGTFAEAGLSLLDKCKLGFQTEHIKAAAGEMTAGELDLNVLYHLEYRYTRERLMRLRSIGEKFADFVLLFAFEKMESFPVDTHVRRIIQYYHIDDSGFETCTNLGCVGEWGREYFGYYCGCPGVLLLSEIIINL